MKKLTFILAFVALAAGTTIAQEQKPEVIKLTQVDGKFTNKQLNLKPGTYIFEVTNKGVEREVGLVVANLNEEGDAGEHIPEGYLSNAIKSGETAQSKVVVLEEGEYKYFCPLNPTPEYSIKVSE
mgnify:CR=1 FL=1